MFSKETEDKFKHLASIYPRKRSALIPMLLLAQKEDGYIKSETVEYVGKYLDLDPSEVDSILSFYTLLRRRPVGKYHIMICTNLACLLQGSDEIEACVKFECLGACTTAPAIQINGEFYENLDVKKTEDIIDELRKRG